MDYSNTRDVLRRCSNEDLAPLVEIVTKQITNSLCVKDNYKKDELDYHMYVDDLFDDICEFGGNSFVNVFRGEGPNYNEIITDVAKAMKVVNIDGGLIKTELQILSKVFELTLDNLPDQEKEELLKKMQEEGIGPEDIEKLKYIRGAALSAMFRVTPYLLRKVMKVVLKQFGEVAVGRVATFAASRFFSVLTGLFGWVIGGAWTVLDISSPAKRVTIPCVIHIAIIRMTIMNEEINDKYVNYL